MILEIRAGTGGSEAALWAADLARMYTKFAENQRWRVKQLDAHQDNFGGYKEISFQISPLPSSSLLPYPLLRYEAGVHRVQRIPKTESAGRIHTSTATVAVLPEPGEEATPSSPQAATTQESVLIKPSDLKIETFRSSGPGGQHVNKVESGVRITHLPSGISVEATSERSQYQNKQVALALLEHKIREELAKQRKTREDRLRRSQIGSGERSEKIRTYNFPQNRVTDHRLNQSWYTLDRILDGELEPIVKALQKASQ